MTDRVFHAAQVRRGQRVLITTTDAPEMAQDRAEIVEMLQQRFPGVEFTLLCGVSGLVVTSKEDGTPGRRA
jgi:hypothetical protein